MTNASDRWRHPAIAAIVGGIVGGILPCAIAIICVVMTYNYTSSAQNRQSRLEALVRFDQNSGKFVTAAGGFIKSINSDGKGLEAQRDKIREVAADQMLEIDSISRAFPGASATNDYRSAVSEFNKVTQSTESVTDMRPWAESFGRVIDTRDELNRQISSQLGLKS